MPDRILKICAGFSVAVFCYLTLVLGIIIYFNAPNSYHNHDQKFIVNNGMTFREVVEKLHDKEIIKNPTSFLYIAQLVKGLDPKVHYGEYFFEKNISYYRILHKMVEGNIFFRKVTIAEGLSSDSTLKIINDSKGLVGNLPSAILEGSLLPETYFYSYNDSKISIIQRMQEAMQKTIDELWQNRDPNIPVRTKKEALILASIVEKETGVKEERPKVASVFINRLNKSMKLQSDPTIIYSFTFGNKELERPIRMSDIQNNSSFNTYHIYGLPPTPICNPGIDSIKAVLNPIKTEFLFFVASGNGDHVFTSSLREHNIYVAKYRNLMRKKELERIKKMQINQEILQEEKILTE